MRDCVETPFGAVTVWLGKAQKRIMTATDRNHNARQRQRVRKTKARRTQAQRTIAPMVQPKPASTSPNLSGRWHLPHQNIVLAALRVCGVLKTSPSEINLAVAALLSRKSPAARF